MLLTGYAGQISLGHAGLLAAGAFTTGILFKETGAPFWVTLPASAAVGALLGRHLRPAEPAAARPVPRRVDARAAFHRDPCRQRVRDQAGLFHRHRDRSAAARRLGAERPARLVLRAARGRGGDGALRRSTCCARGPDAPGARSTAARRWPRRSASACPAPSSPRSSSRRTLTAVAGCLFAYYRGFVSAEAFSIFLDHPVRRHGDHRRHGLDARRAARHRVRGAVSLRHRRRDGARSDSPSGSPPSSSR